MFHDSAGMESPKRILGLEGGGTKTTWVLLAEDGSVVHEGMLPAANLRLITDDALRQLFSVLPREATHVGIFLAGCASDEDRTRLVAETADLLYHLLVVLEVRGVSLAEVEAVLGERTRQTGLDEKAARKGG